MLLDIFHPFAGTRRHLFKLDTLPYRLVQPTGNGRGQQTDDAYLDAALVVDGVGLQTVVDVRRIGGSVLVTFFHHVGSHQRTAHLANPLVVHLVTRFQIVVAKGLDVVFHVVDDAGRQIDLVRCNKVRPVDTRLSLHDVAIVYQQQVVAILLAFLINIAVSTHQRPVNGLALGEVPWEEVAMNVAGLYHLQLDSLIAFRSTRHRQGTHHQNS